MTDRYRAAKRRADKAERTLTDAAARLIDTGAGDNGDYLNEDTFRAVALLDAAAKRVWTELMAVKNAEGVGTYKPYGRDFARRY